MTPLARRTALLSLLGGLVSPGAALADAMLEVGDPLALSVGTGQQSPDMDAAAKVKLARLGNGTLVAVWSDGASGVVYDVKERAERPARDVFVRTCSSSSVDCTQPDSWSAALNLSQTARLSSASTAWRGPDIGAMRFAGDSDKPNLFKQGSTLVLTWVDKYCPGGEQGTVSYPELEERELPFSCTWVSRSTNSGATWSAPQQLTDGSRDAKQDINRGNDKAWVITWQEDPVGLQLGQAEGPGDGASGAKVSHGTDIWYTALSAEDLAAGVPFPEPVRLTDNFSKMLTDDGNPTETESGQTGASRANLAQVGGTVLLAYEETKGTEGLDVGKYIRYQIFSWNAPPDSCAPDESEEDGCLRGHRGQVIPAQDDPARMGCILSNPERNARRARILSQGTPGDSGTRLLVFWKEGEDDQGGPSDIVARRGLKQPGDEAGTAGLRPQDLVPAVVVPTASVPGDELDGCLLRGDEELGTGAWGNAQALNLSTLSDLGGDLSLDTEDDPLEDARAHRGAIKGDVILFGYSYTTDWAVARYTDLETYDFWVRASHDGGESWTEPLNLSEDARLELAESLGLEPTGVLVKEPRIVKTPGDGPGCPSGDPQAEDTTKASDCSADDSFLVAFGTETNVYELEGGGEDLDLFVLRTTNAGLSYEQAAVLGGTQAAEKESQLQLSPDGETVFAVFNHSEGGDSDALYVEAWPEMVALEDGGADEDPAEEPDVVGEAEERSFLWWTCSTATPGAGLGLALLGLLGLARRREG